MLDKSKIIVYNEVTVKKDKWEVKLHNTDSYTNISKL